MIDYFVIFTQGGLVLWSVAGEEAGYVTATTAINALIHSVLLEQKGGVSLFTSGDQSVRWTLDNKFGLVFAVVFKKMLSLLYLPDLLNLVKTKFCELYADKLQSGKKRPIYLKFDDFREHFERIHLGLSQLNVRPTETGPRRFKDTEKGKLVAESTKKKKKNKKKKKGGNKKQESSDESESSNSESEESGSSSVDRSLDISLGEEEIDVPLDNSLPVSVPSGRGARGRGMRGRGRGRGKVKPSSNSSSSVTKPKGKKKRRWNGGDSDDDIELDRSRSPDIDLGEKVGRLDFDLEGKEEDIQEEISKMLEKEEEKKAEGQQPRGFFSRFLPNLTNRPLTPADLEEPLGAFRQQLVDKNVASDVADKICDSVGKSLEGRNLPSFSRVGTVVGEAMVSSITNILTPKRSIDVLRGVELAKAEGRPFVMTFVGVNGVGKSTSLAKITSWLQSNGHRVMIAACDTFRSGAVEQLRTHARRIDAELYERGYGKDAADIARNAIKHAKDLKNIDVVLVDTAGRMQDNRPLMRALGKLVQVNKPDLVIFVGEALVGNDGVDQLVKFNSALAAVMQEEGSHITKDQVIDGIFLTKFDTIDDKVGAAISMVYTTGQPILFLGTGQQYTDLKKMNISSVVKALLQ